MPALYLDYNATHPPDTESIKEASQLYFENYANTSGISRFSQKASFLLENARRNIAQNLNIHSKQIIFTSCATESNALFMQSMLKYLHSTRRNRLRALISPLEHPSVTETLRAQPDIEISILKSEKNGILDLEYLEEKLKEKPDMLCISHTHNETGIIQPFHAIARILEKYPVVTLFDSVQTLPKINNLSLKKENIFEFSKSLPVFFSVSGHKIGAGFGTGILIRPDSSIGNHLENYVFAKGGGQEFDIRPGTHNLASILSFEKVLDKRLKDDKLLDILSSNTDFFERKITEKLNIGIIGSNAPRVPGVTALVFNDINIDFLLLALDQKEISVSTGSSCKSKTKKPSPALLALGYSEKEASNVLRISYGKSFEHETAARAANEIHDIAQKIS